MDRLFAEIDRLRTIPATSRNAIALLRVLGAPAQLVERAVEICGTLEDAPLAPAAPI